MVQSRRDFLKLAAMTAGSLPFTGCLESKVLKNTCKRSNVVFFLVDDLGWSDLGCYGSTFYETPAIDQLAKDGVLFDNAYATCHVCSPSRASIQTGKYPGRTDLTEWLRGRGERDYEKLHSAKKLMALPDEEQTLAETLKAQGYSTVFYGKAHLGKEPGEYGFDETTSGWYRSYHYPFKGIIKFKKKRPVGPDGKKGTIQLPGWGGGADWAGAAFDPDTGWLYVPSITSPIGVALLKPDAARSTMRYTRGLSAKTILWRNMKRRRVQEKAGKPGRTILILQLSLRASMKASA